MVNLVGLHRAAVKSRGPGGMACEFSGRAHGASHNWSSDSPPRRPCGELCVLSGSLTHLPPAFPHPHTQMGWERKASGGLGRNIGNVTHRACPSWHFPSCGEEHSLFHSVHILEPLGYVGGWGCQNTRPSRWWNSQFRGVDKSFVTSCRALG